MYVMTRLFPVRHTRHVGKMTKIKIHGADEKAQKAAEAGEWFDALAVEIHWGCSGYRR
jgi:hypothetical protein